MAGRKMLFILAIASLMLPVWEGGSAFADPPPWAPAHGYRHKHKHHHEDDEDDEHYEVREIHATYVVPFGIERGTCNREALGQVLGGVTGAAVGSTIGKGSGRTAATAGGAIIGVIVGGSIGRSMDSVDQNCVGQILEHAPDGRRVVWSDPDAGRRYAVVPTQTFRAHDGRYCREYTTQAAIGGKKRQVYGTACRQPDGSWEVVN